MSRLYSHFSDLKISGAGTLTTPKPGAKTGPAAPTWSAGGKATAPKWTPGDKGLGGWPKGFYVQHQGIENTKHAKHGLSKGKAKEMLKHGEVHGEPLSKKQKGYFGVVAGGGKPSRLKK